MNKIPANISKLVPGIQLLKYHKQADSLFYGVSNNAFIIISNSCVNLYKFKEMSNISKFGKIVQFDYHGNRHEYSISDQFIVSKFPNNIELLENELSLEYTETKLQLESSRLQSVDYKLQLIETKAQLSSSISQVNKLNSTVMGLKETNSRLAAELELTATRADKLAIELMKRTTESNELETELENLKRLHNPELFKHLSIQGVDQKLVDELIKEIKTIIINNIE